MTDPSTVLQAALVDRYRIEREVGRGGMATVYLAEDLKHHRAVALKVLHPELALAFGTERFLREIETVAHLTHPHILPLHDSGEAGGLLYYVMPYIEGESLRSRLLRETQLPVEEALAITREVASALDYAHRHNVVHRDLKPENILLSDGHALVADFGIARPVLRTGQQSLTGTGMAIGTPAYMSPEQAAASESIDGRSDIYVLGCVLYEMLAGEPPFTGPTPQATIAKQLVGTIPPLRVVRPNVSVLVEEAVSRALARVPADRFQTARAFAESLGAPQSGSATPRADRPVNRRGLTYAAAGLVFVMAVAGLFRAVRDGPGDATGSARPNPAGATTELKSIAVLPFANVSSVGGSEYFSDGLTEELINTLARVQGLRVAARTSSFAFKGKNLQIDEIARQLKVEAVLEGSVRQAGDSLRISAQLVNAQDGFPLWSQSYDRRSEDVFAVQEEIARAIVASLKLRLPGGANAALLRGGTADAAAHDLYLRGRHAWNKRTPDGFQQAVRHFQQAIERDSLYAAAYSGLADTYLSLYDYELIAPKEATAKASMAAARALKIDPTLAEARNSLAHLHLHEWKWAAAESEFKRAIELDPGYAPSYHWYALSLTTVGRLEEAVAAMTTAQQLDPLSLRMNADLGMALLAAAQYDQAIAQERRTLELDPNFPTAYWIAGMAYEQKGMYADARREFERAIALRPGNPNYLASLASVHALDGREAESRAILRDLEAQAAKRAASPFFVALVHTALGDKDAAFRWLERAYQERSGSIRYLKMERRLDRLRSDPRYADLMRRVGLPQ